MDPGPWGGLSADVYCTNDLAFALPDRQWVDRTVYSLEVSADEERTCSLVVHRTPLEPGDALDALVTDALRRAGREKREHEVLHQTCREIAGRPGIDVAMQWRGTQSMVYVRQAHLTNAGVWLVFGISGGLEDAQSCDKHLERLIRTLRLRT